MVVTIKNRDWATRGSRGNASFKLNRSSAKPTSSDGTLAVSGCKRPQIPVPTIVDQPRQAGKGQCLIFATVYVGSHGCEGSSVPKRAFFLDAKWFTEVTGSATIAYIATMDWTVPCSLKLVRSRLPAVKILSSFY